MAEGGLKIALRDNIIKNVIDVAFQNMKQKSALMVVDDGTMRTLDYCMKVHMLNDKGVGVIVNIKYTRERVRIPPIYFISPNLKSVRSMVADYEDESKLQYGAPIHLFFVGSVTPECMEEIKNSSLPRYLKTFSEVYCDFLPVERNVFSFDRVNAMSDIYVNKDGRTKEIERCSENLISLCTTLNEDPYVRYSSTSEVAEDLAHMFQNSFQRKKAQMTGFTPAEDRATLYILDRAEEPEALLMHEVTYQSMIQDLLDCEGKILKLLADDGAEDPFYFEDDPVWPELFLENMADVNKLIKDKFNYFKANSAMAKQQNSGDSSSMLKAIRDLPRYKKMAKSFNCHFKIYGLLADQFKSLKLMNVSDLEQSLVTGIDDEGSKVKATNLQAQVSKFLQDESLPTSLKQRLLMIYVISQGGLSDDVMQKLIEAAGLGNEEIITVQHLERLGFPLTTTGKVRNKRFKDEMQGRAKALLEEATEKMTMQSRFDPEVGILLRAHGSDPGNLDGKFPYKGDKWRPPKKEAGTNRKNKRFGNMFSRGKKPGQPAQKTASGARVIIMIVGGVGFSEIRQAYMASDRMQREVYIGGTSTLTPAQFLTVLRGAQTDVADEKVEE